MAKDPFDDFDDEDDGYLTFDARDEQEGGKRNYLILAGAVLLVVVIGIVGYNLFLGNAGSSDDAPVVAAADGEFKDAPDPAAPVVPDDADKGVLDPAAAEAPALSVEPLSGAEDPLLDASATGVPGAAAPTPAPAAASPPPPPPPVRKAEAAPTPARTAAAPPPPPPPPAKKAEAPAPRPAARPASPPPPPPAAQPTRQAEAAPASPPPPPAASQGGGTGRLAAQLGSFQTRAAAEAALARYRADGLGGTVSVVAADLGAKGTWYRIRAVGFESRSEVDQFCSAARARGVNCIAASR